MDDYGRRMIGPLTTKMSSGNYVDARAYGTLGLQSSISDAISDIGTSNRTLYISPGTWSINSDLSIPSNITLRVERGAILSVATGKTLTIAGSLEAGDYQIFSWVGTGSIILSDVSEIKTTWFGDTGAGINKAISAVPINGGTNNTYPRTICMPGRAITLEVLVTISNRKIVLCGAGANRYDSTPYGGTTLTWEGSGPGIYLSASAGIASTHISLRDFALVGNATGAVGLRVGTDKDNVITYLHADNLSIRGFTGPGIDWRGAEYANLHRVQSTYNGGPGLSVGSGYTALVKFDTCTFGHNTQEGVLIDPGSTVGSTFANVTFINCDIQSNGYEAVKVVSTRSLAVKNLKIISCWWEGNNSDAARLDGGYYDINLDGLAYNHIGNVTLIGNEFGGVSNKIGAELVTNGSFTTDTNWNKGANWTIAGDVAVHTAGSTAVLSPSVSLNPSINSWYLVSYTIGSRTAGYIKPVLGDRSGPTRSVNGAYYDTIYTTAATNLQFVPTSEFNGTIDNVSVKKILNKALYAKGVSKLTCQGNQWENVDGYGTQCVFGDVGSSIIGALNFDDPIKLWEWNEFVKIYTNLLGESYTYGATATGTCSGVVINNANIPKFTWTCSTFGGYSLYHDYGGGSANSLSIVAQGTKSGTVGSKVISLTFGGRTIGTLTSTNASPWTIKSDVGYLYQTGSGAGTFYYTTQMFDGNTVTHTSGTLSSAGSSSVNVYENVTIQIVATSPTAGETITSTALRYMRI